MTVPQGTTARRQKFSHNGHHHGTPQRDKLQARGRFLLSDNSEGSFIIGSRGEGGMLGWASTACEPERQPRSTIRLLALLILRNRELEATRRRVFGFPALAAQAIEQEILAKRRELLGVGSWSRDRSSLRVVAGDGQAATMAA